MNLNELTMPELVENLQRLHGYLNRKYFHSTLTTPFITFCRLAPDASFIPAAGIQFSFEALTRYRLLAKRMPETVERIQFQWLVTSMLHAMVLQRISEQNLPETDYPSIAEGIGLMDAGSRAEWINPLRFAFIEQEFHLNRPERREPLPDSFQGGVCIGGMLL